jgi:hypothetical protein
MNGDLRDVNDAFDEGDEYSFTLEHLKGGSDINVARLVGLLEMIEQTVDTTINLNALKKKDE